MTDSDNGHREPSREREDADAVPDRERPPTLTKPVKAADIAVVYRRAGAYVIDSLLVGFVTLLLAFATGIDIANVAAGGSADALGLARWEAVAILLYRWVMQSTFGFTVGKQFLGLRVVAADGAPAGPIAILGRELVLFAIANLGPFIPPLQALLLLPWVLSVVNLWIALRRRDHRGIHDLPVRTRVVRREDAGIPGSRPPPPPPPRSPGTWLRPG